MTENLGRPISLNPAGHDGRNIQIGLGQIVDYLRKPNASQKCQQLLAEVSAGKEYIKAPIAERNILEKLLAKPLRQIANEAHPEHVQKIAKDFLSWFSHQV